MAVFTAIGTAIGASAATAFTVGVGATALAAGVGMAASSMGAAGQDGRIESSVGTGALSDDEISSAAKKRMFRSGVMFTSPTGLDNQPRTSSAKLK